MKATTLLTAGLFFVALPAVAQQPMAERPSPVLYCERISAIGRSYLEKAARGYNEALKSDVDGVVESSITFSTILRIAAPQLDLNDIRAKIDDLAVNGDTPTIRYKAYLASMVFQNPEEFEGAVGTTCPESNQFFGAVAERVSKRLLGFSGE